MVRKPSEAQPPNYWFRASAYAINVRPHSDLTPPNGTCTTHASVVT